MTLALQVGLLFVSTAAAIADDAADLTIAAEELFERYVSLESAFDPAIADLYADDALIENTRFYPSGETKTLQFPVETYRDLIRQMMPVAEQLDDASTYSEVTYSVEAERVRIRAMRYGHRKDYTMPFELLVGRGSDGSWLIFEEISQSVP